MTTRGHCLCGSVRWEFHGDVAWTCYCHCDDCRRNCGAPVVAWLGVPIKNFKWLGVRPKTFESSKGVRRHFCGTCGSPIGFEADHYAGGMHLYAASLEHPESCPMAFHVNYESRLPWLKMDDELPKYDGKLLNGPEKPSY